MIKKINLNLAEKSYDILVGTNSIQNLSDFLTQKNYSKIIIITDENLAKFHLEFLYNFLIKNCGLENKPKNLIRLIISSGEASKSFSVLEEVCEKILQQNIDRKSLIIAFGGGVVGDLAGFLASILLRGIDFIQIPTTLLAMVDSAVGGKTAINSKSGKNLIGSFYQPKLVICDLQFLETLPYREFLAGYAEILKYGLIHDENFFNFLRQKREVILDKSEIQSQERLELIKKIICRSCEIKAEIVGRDEKESKERALLNFGHSFGHIFETETNYGDELLHGEAVALGMAMAIKMSQNFNLLSNQAANEAVSELEKCGFILNPMLIRQSWNKNQLISHIFADKKNENQQLTFILLEKIGSAKIVKNVDLSEFVKIIDEFIE